MKSGNSSGGARLPGRRWFFQIIRDILAKGSGTKTDFMYAGQLNSQQLNRYMDFLLSNSFLKETPSESRPTIYQVTPDGDKALAKLQEIIRLLGVDRDGRT
jgi:predicted transcriptional regulator